MKSIFNKLLPLIMGTLLLPMSLNAAEIVLMVGQSGTSTTGGAWHYASAASMGLEGNKGLYTPLSAGNKTYTFAPELPLNTIYQVEIYNSCYSPRSTQVLHTINHADGVSPLSVNQDCSSDEYVGQWRPLGSYNFQAGTSGSVIIDTTGSNNLYVGVTAVKFIYDDSALPGLNQKPVLTPLFMNVEVNEGDLVNVSAIATDAEDGDLSSVIHWQALGQSLTGSEFLVTAGSESFTISLQVTDSAGLSTIESVLVNVTPSSEQPDSPSSVVYQFDCLNLEPLVGFTSNNVSALPNVGTKCGKYVAELTSNSNNKTLHFNQDQGRFDGVQVTFPFSVIARNVGTASMGDLNSHHSFDGSAFNFVGLQVHTLDLDNPNSAHLVVGQRGNVVDTIEGKMTYNGSSRQSDIGSNQLPDGRADLRIVGDASGNIKAYWQLPNLTNDILNDNWLSYGVDGDLPGTLPEWSGSTVFVGLITYAYYSNGLPFIGVADSLEVNQ